MAQFRPFAIAPISGLNVPGAQTIDRIVIGVDQNDYYNNHAELQWIAGPDEELGIIIAYHDETVPYHSNSLTPSNLYNIGFLRASDEPAFVELVNSLGNVNANNGNEAKQWLNANGYWTSFDESPWPFGYTPTPTPPTSSAWYFYSDTGNLNAGPPVANGNAIFLNDANQPSVETYNPNNDVATKLYFNLHDSNGVDYTTEFTNLMNNGGTISITQPGIGQSATYTATAPNQVQIIPNSGFVFLNVAVMTQSTSTDGPFIYEQPIIISFIA